MSGFSLKPTLLDEVEYKIPDVEFECIIADFDTPVFQAAKSVQEDFIIVTIKRKGKPFGLNMEGDVEWLLNSKGNYFTEFKNKTTFYGHHSKKEGGWLSGLNELRVNSGKPALLPDEFEIEECARLKEGINHMEEAVNSFDYAVGQLKRAVKANDYKLLIGGGGNFRYDAAHLLPYKGTRTEKPILFLEIRDAVIDKYKNKIHLAFDEEADDLCGQYGFENYKNYLKTGKWKYVLAHVDKDILMVPSPHFNYANTDLGIEYVDSFQGAKYFCAQLISGDKAVDNIGGLPEFTNETKEKYKLRKVRGAGKATALQLLEGCTTIKEMFERVVDAYRSYYGDSYEFTSHRGEEMEYTWLDCLRENAILLYMRRKPNEMYDIENTLKNLGIDYE